MVPPITATKRESSGWYDHLNAHLEAFLITRAIICSMPLIILSDVVTDLLAALEFAMPPDGGPTEKNWTILSFFFLFIVFRIQMLRYLTKKGWIAKAFKRSRRLSTSHVQWYHLTRFQRKQRHLDVTIVKLLLTGIPFSMVFIDVFEVEDMDCTYRLMMIFLEIGTALSSLFWPIILIWDVVDLTRLTWRRTGRGDGVPIELIELGFIESLESLSQLSLQARAYSVGALGRNIFITSAFFSVGGILKACMNYWGYRHSFKLGEFTRVRHADWSLRSLSSVPELFVGNSIVETIDMSNNNFGSVKSDAWARFLARFGNLTKLDLSWCFTSSAGVSELMEAFKTNETVQHLNLAHNDISSEGMRAVVEMLKTNKTLRYLHLDFNGDSKNDTQVLADGLKQNDVLLVVTVEGLHDVDILGELEGYNLQTWMSPVRLSRKEVKDETKVSVLEPMEQNLSRTLLAEQNESKL